MGTLRQQGFHRTIIIQSPPRELAIYIREIWLGQRAGNQQWGVRKGVSNSKGRAGEVRPLQFRKGLWHAWTSCSLPGLRSRDSRCSQHCILEEIAGWGSTSRFRCWLCSSVKEILGKLTVLALTTLNSRLKVCTFSKIPSSEVCHPSLLVQTANWAMLPCKWICRLGQSGSTLTL